MNEGELRAALLLTWDDHQLSRSERKALQELVLAASRPEDMRHRVRHAAFALAGELVGKEGAAGVLAWLDDVVRAVWPPVGEGPPVAEAHFSPDGDPCGRLVGLIDGASQRLDVCVFTITDDRLAIAIARAQERGVRVRVLTDGDKAEDIGADVLRLRQAGVPVRFELSEVHMHHKFMLADDVLVTGSYNWTRSASRANFENIVVLGERRLVERFEAEFERLWRMWV